MTDKSLRDIYTAHEGLVSDKWDSYLIKYNRLFQPIRTERIQLLEIGVQNGGSLEIWSKFFPNAVAIVGCDVDQGCAKLRYSDARISVIVDDITSPSAKLSIESVSADFHIIIDDGSHTSSDIIGTFFGYFPLLKMHGHYIIEDLHCSYWTQFEGGLSNQFSSMNFLKDLSDLVNHEHWGVDISRTQFLEKFGVESNAKTEQLLSEIHSVEFVNSMCIVTRQPAMENLLGIRHVVGTQELVSQNKFANGTYSIPPSQETRDCESSADHLTDKDEYILSLKRRIAELESKPHKVHVNIDDSYQP